MNKTYDTIGIKTLLGDPKKAIKTFSPLAIIAMLLNASYPLIDSFWVSGLSDTSLAAIGFINPIYLGIIGISTGLALGANSVITKYIGEKNKEKASNSALHILLIGIVLSIICTIFLEVLLEPILQLLAAKPVIESSLNYGRILFSGTFLIIFTNVLYGIFRAEANSKRAIKVMLFGAILNAFLDPLFIYYFNLGIKGAAIATISSLSIISLLLVYLYRKDTYLNLSFKEFKYSKNLLLEISNIFIPASIEYMIIAITTAIINYILIINIGLNGVAIYTGGWAVVELIMTPTIAIGTIMIIVISANFGRKNYENILKTQDYVIKISILIAIILSIIVFIIAPFISYLFTYSANAAQISSELTYFLRVTCLYYLFLPFGISASSLFRGIGKGLNSLISNVFSSLILQIIFAYIFTIVLNFGENGVWYGIILGNSIGCLISFIWSKYYIKKLIDKKGLITPYKQ
ncbi:MATE family efflux transporter [Methanobrevibacter sp. OttesenSCG-928-K11]|nr:MATE family efflux transporter [Methanobrevibacter sp. OttesenSCG-928-K11]MDL2270885.1 MATE family efflux transporter [Methanobrevibacter sp. OttesenSCG-928-I08]